MTGMSKFIQVFIGSHPIIILGVVVVICLLIGYAIIISGKQGTELKENKRWHDD